MSSARLTPSLASSPALLSSPGMVASPSEANLDPQQQQQQLLRRRQREESDPAHSLRGRQVSALRQMLRLQEQQRDEASSLSATTPNLQWKVLVFDRVGQDLLAPVMSVKALREEGVTLHLYIMSER